MHRTLALLAMTALVPVGLAVSSPGVAYAGVALGGSTTCTSLGTSAQADFTQGLSANPAAGDAIVVETATFTCSTGGVTPAVTSLEGALKLKLYFHKSGANVARKCSKFEGSSPVDVVADSVGGVNWLAYNGSTNLGADPSGLLYSGTYNADTGGALSVDLTPTTATVGGSFAGTLAALTLVLPRVQNACPVAPGFITATSGALSI